MRWTRWAPCDAGAPPNPWRFIDTGEALALADRGDVDELTGFEQVRGELLAHLIVADVLEAQLEERDAGVDPGRSVLTGGGLVQLARVPVAVGDLEGAVAVAFWVCGAGLPVQA
ncbi:MAG: hypothetical protein V9E94_10150 [Microthrixaceae bacterium]